MDPWVVLELLVIFVLLLANGFFAAAEIAIITAGRGQLTHLAESGDRRARLALELADNPSRFFPTVQIGISLVSTFAAAFGGAKISLWLADRLTEVPLAFVAEYRVSISLTVVVLGISFVSVVIGELVPKRLALHYPVGIARFVSGPLNVLASIVRPLVWVMSRVTDALLLPLGVVGVPVHRFSREEIEHLLELGTAEGELEPVEQKLAIEALWLGERFVKQIMRPRIDIDAADVDTPPEEVLGAVVMAGFSRLPVYEHDLDHVLGILHLKDVLRQHYLGWPIDLRKLVRPPLFVLDTMSIDELLVMFRDKDEDLAIVVDEFGNTKGMVTLEDVLQELVGEIGGQANSQLQTWIVQRDSNSWIVDGSASIDELLEQLDSEDLEPFVPRNVGTVAGLVFTQFGRMPSVGDSALWQNLKLEVVDMDGPRIDSVLVSRLSSEGDLS